MSRVSKGNTRRQIKKPLSNVKVTNQTADGSECLNLSDDNGAINRHTIPDLQDDQENDGSGTLPTRHPNTKHQDDDQNFRNCLMCSENDFANGEGDDNVNVCHRKNPDDDVKTSERIHNEGHRSSRLQRNSEWMSMTFYGTILLTCCLAWLLSVLFNKAEYLINFLDKTVGRYMPLSD